MRAGLALLALLAAGCGVAEGSWGEVRFAPDRGGLAVADRHEILTRGGSLAAVLKAEASRSLHLLLSDLRLDDGVEWRRLPADELRALRLDLATRDHALVEGVPLTELTPGALIVLDESQIALGLEQPAPDVELGALRATLIIDDARVEPLEGFVRGRLELEREGGEAAGVVNVPFDLALARERLGKANLAIAAPVVRCAEARPGDAAACADAPAEPVIDASASVR